MREGGLLEARWLYHAPGELPHGREARDYVMGEDKRRDRARQ